jgi:hypothetical protein
MPIEADFPEVEQYVDELGFLSSRAEALPVGQEYTMRSVAGLDWDWLKARLGARAFGIAYARQVRNGTIAHSRIHSIDSSPRQNRYIRI